MPSTVEITPEGQSIQFYLEGVDQSRYPITRTEDGMYELKIFDTEQTYIIFKQVISVFHSTFCIFELSSKGNKTE
jgi:hypothetical protein